MIDRGEILAVTTDLSLTADVVEKDYVLGWLLAAIYAHPQLARTWVFKGGTCLKKCYFETYRFSEDLDFTLTTETQLDADFLLEVFREVVAWLYEKTGIEIPPDQMRFEVYRNKRQTLNCEGRVYYKGPLGRGGSLPRIKLDITADEILVLPPIERRVSHPYSDLPERGITARCYAYEEVMAEKTRALAERTRPRDLYDVVNLFRHGEFHPAAATVLDVLRKKCDFKGIPVPTVTSLDPAATELIADWDVMLRHQLPVLPPFDSFWAVLPDFFMWLQSGAARTVLASAPLPADEHLFRPAVGLLRREGVRGSSFLETIRFAGANRLCVDLTYRSQDGRAGVRRIEPYSLRRSRVGDILLFALRSSDGQSRSYRLDRILGAVMTNQSFVPRFEIELTPADPGPIPSLDRGVAFTSIGQLQPRRAPGDRAPKPSRGYTTGPTYIYQCGVCQKKFRHAKQNPHLGSHKAPGGWKCSGRTGILVETKY